MQQADVLDVLLAAYCLLYAGFLLCLFLSCEYANEFLQNVG
jgi:hypothetical protein